MKAKVKKITKAKQALAQNRGLESYWSQESQLSQFLLIYIAELLEKILSELKTRRGQSAYNAHVGAVIRGGGTMKDAAELWQAAKKEEL